MNYYERIQKSINYIETNLKEELIIEKVAREAYMSLSNYYRMFFSLTGHTVKEYIRKRRLTLATNDLLTSSRTILDIALDYDFDNGDTFTKAFKKVTGHNPREFKKQRKQYYFERMNLLKMYYEECELDEKYPDIRVLKNMPPMRVAYYCYYGKEPEDGAFKVITKWLKTSGLNFEKDRLRIFGYNNPSPTSPNQKEYGYEVCVTIPDNYLVQNEKIHVKTLPGGLYAVQGVNFNVNGNGEEIVEAWKKFTQWLKESNYCLAKHQWLEEHLQFNNDFEFVAGMDLYMPIKEK